MKYAHFRSICIVSVSQLQTLSPNELREEIKCGVSDELSPLQRQKIQ